MMYRHILVALDGSRFAERALEPALQLALRFEARATFLRVVSEETQPLVLGPGRLPLTLMGPGDATAEFELEEAESYLNSIQHQWAGCGIPVRIEVTRGDPATMILDTAAAVDADLIVMTTHGRSGMNRWIYGSVAEAVLRRSHVPVLLLPLHTNGNHR